MPAIRYLDRLGDPSRRTITTSGLQSGPPGGDGWSLVSTLPQAKIGLDAPGKVAIYVTGRISNTQVFGALPPSPTGVLQVCAGDSSGLKSNTHLFHVSVRTTLVDENEGIPFAFLIMVSDDVTDPSWGAAFPNTVDLQLHARLWWAQDQPTYGVQWDVSDVEYVVVNVEDIPTGDVETWAGTGPWQLGNPGQSVINGPDLFVELDEQWMHFGVVHYEPGRDPDVPFFIFGMSDGPGAFDQQVGDFTVLPGFVPHGIGWQSAQFWNRKRTQGVWWCGAGDGVHKRPSLFPLMTWTGGPDATIVERVAFLSVKLDNLPSVMLTTEDVVNDLTDYESVALTTTRRVVREVSSQLLSWEPIVFVSALPYQNAGAARRFFGAHLSDSDNEVLIAADAPVIHDGRNAAQVYGATSNGIGYGDAAFQYLLRVLQPGSGSRHFPVHDIFMAVVHPIRDPDGQAPTVPDVGDPIPIVPGAEGPPAASLDAPILAPNASMQEAPQTTTQRQQQIASGYRRTWGVWLKPRRVFRLTWSPVSRAERDSLLAFLRAGKLWKFRPNQSDVDLAVATIEAPEAPQLSGQTWSVSVSVAELVYTV